MGADRALADAWSSSGARRRVLEPGTGDGTFVTWPRGAQMVGVELDPTTAAIAGAVPGATIRTETFSSTRIGSGHFEAGVGNRLIARRAEHG